MGLFALAQFQCYRFVPHCPSRLESSGRALTTVYFLKSVFMYILCCTSCLGFIKAEPAEKSSRPPACARSRHHRQSFFFIRFHENRSIRFYMLYARASCTSLIILMRSEINSFREIKVKEKN